jgi:hypothetical protein
MEDRFVAELAWRAIRLFRLGGLLLQIHPKSYLRKHGWFRSFQSKSSIDLLGKPIPWWSYGVIDFVDERLSKSMSVLEFGSGGSTLWLSSRVEKVLTIENDSGWAQMVKTFVPENVTVIELPVPNELTMHDLPPSNNSFHVLIIDAFADRIKCAKAGLSFLTQNGVVVWDNTDGPDWFEIKRFMAKQEFKEISFSGVAPQEVSESRTTIFYRNDNVFGI